MLKWGPGIAYLPPSMELPQRVNHSGICLSTYEMAIEESWEKQRCTPSLVSILRSIIIHLWENMSLIEQIKQYVKKHSTESRN